MSPSPAPATVPSHPSPLSDPDSDTETLRGARALISLTSIDIAAASDSEDSGSDNDLELLRRLQARFNGSASSSGAANPQPLAARVAVSDSDSDDDFETLRVIQRRFEQYDNGAMYKTSGLHLEEAETVVGVTTGRETPDTLSMSEKHIPHEEFPDSVTTESHHAEEHIPHEEFPDSVTTESDHAEDQIPHEEFPDSVTTESHHAEDETDNIYAKAFTYSQFPKSAQYFVEALRKNRLCQKLLRRKLIGIEAKIEENKELRGRIKCVMDFQAACNRKTGRLLCQEKDPRVRLIASRKSSTVDTPKNRWRKARALRFGPAENSHVSKYKMTMMKFPISLCKLPWSDIENDNLVKGLKQQYQEMLMLNLMNVESDLGSPGDTSLVPALSSSDLEVTLEKIQSFLPLVNWDRLASMYLTGRSGAECESRWLNSLDPMVNHNQWTIVEDKKLLYIVQERGLYNWIDIAIALGTHRTPFQCLVRYQRSLNPHILNRDWTDEDDAMLRAAVEAFGYEWQVVASNVEGRSSNQCSSRWRKCLNPDRKTVGRWSVDEDKRLKVAVTLFGEKNWNKIALFAPGRTQSQCRERWVNCLNPSLNLEPWTQEEDAKLLAAISEHGFKWSKVASFVPPRTDNQCWRRWKVLLPHEVPLLQANKKIKQTVLISNFVDREGERPLIGPSDFSAPVITLAAEDASNKTAKKRASSHDPLKKSRAKPKRSRKRNLEADGMVNSSSEIAPSDPSLAPSVNLTIAENGRSNRTRKETSSHDPPKKSRAKAERSRKRNLEANGMVNSSTEVAPADPFLVPSVNSTVAETGRNKRRKEISSHDPPKKPRAKPERSHKRNLEVNDMVNSSSEVAPADPSLVPSVNSTIAETGRNKRTRKEISSHDPPKKSRAKPERSRKRNLEANDMVNSSSEVAPADPSLVPSVNSTIAETGRNKRTRKETSRKSMVKSGSCGEASTADVMANCSSGITKSGSCEEASTADVMANCSSGITHADLSRKSCLNPDSVESGSMKRTSSGVPNKTSKKSETSFEDNIMTDAMIIYSSEIAGGGSSPVPGINSTSTMSAKRTRKKKPRDKDFLFY